MRLLLLAAFLVLLSLTGCTWALHVTPDGDTHLSAAAQTLAALSFLVLMIGLSWWAVTR